MKGSGQDSGVQTINCTKKCTVKHDSSINILRFNIVTSNSNLFLLLLKGLSLLFSLKTSSEGTTDGMTQALSLTRQTKNSLVITVSNVMAGWLVPRGFDLNVRESLTYGLPQG